MLEHFIPELDALSRQATELLQRVAIAEFDGKDRHPTQRTMHAIHNLTEAVTNLHAAAANARPEEDKELIMNEWNE